MVRVGYQQIGAHHENPNSFSSYYYYNNGRGINGRGPLLMKEKMDYYGDSWWFGKLVLLSILLFTIGSFLLVLIFYPNTSSDAGGGGGSTILTSSELSSLFENYTKAFNKSYNYQNVQELEKKRSNIQKSMEFIQKLNSKQHEHLLQNSGNDEDTSSQQEDQDLVPWTEGMPKNQGYASWGLTPLADLSPEEFQSEYLDLSMAERIKKRISLYTSQRHSSKHNKDTTNGEFPLFNAHKRQKRSIIPDKVDWRDKKIISNVKHQKDCGACWAFSTVETVESMQALATGKLEPLSVQQVIDCSKNSGNSGCSGGDTCSAVAWMSSRKLSPESTYPLTLKDGTCRLQSSATGAQVASNYSCSELIGAEDKIVELLATHGPVSVAVDATNWQYYVGGVIQWNCDASVNHAVQIVGYDKTTTPHHYIVRNSWGPTFGDDGYLYIATNKNLCGIATEVVWLSVES